MAHAIKSGYLSLGLLSVPVKVFKATEDVKSRFHQVHSCKSRINTQVFCPKCQKLVDRSELQKGFQESKDGALIIINPESIKNQQIRDESIEIVEFVPPVAIDQRRFTGDSYFLGVDKKLPRDQYRLLFAAVLEEKRVALAKFRNGGRERLALIRADAELGCFIMQTLLYDAELRTSEEIPLPEPKPVDPAHMALARKLIEQMSKKALDLSGYKDEYEDRLLKVIAQAREAGGEVAAEAPVQTAAVIDLMAALKASIEKSSGAVEPAKSKPLSKAAAKTAKVKKSA